MYILNQKILKGGVEITPLNIENELTEKQISSLLKNKSIKKQNKKVKENGSIK